MVDDGIATGATVRAGIQALRKSDVARIVLAVPLDVLVVRKLGAPGQPELALGAVTDGDQPQQIFNDRVRSSPWRRATG